VDHVPDISERRKYVRLNRKFTVRVRLLDAKAEAPVQEAQDVSVGGVRVLMPNEVSVGATLNLELRTKG